MDLTDRMSANERLLPAPDFTTAGDARAHTSKQHTAAGVAELALDGTFTRVNPQFCAITGYTEAELRCRRMQNLTHPEDLPLCCAILADAVAHGTPSMHEQRYVRPDGSTVWVSMSMAVICDRDGLPERVVTVVTDLTARKHAEAALRASEQKYRTLFDSIDQGFCVFEMLFDASGRPVDYRFTETNAVFEQQTGLIGAVGRTARELVPNLEAHWFDIYGAVARTGESVRFEQWAEGMDRWFDVFASRVGGNDSRTVALVFKNITERKHHEAALRESEARLQTIADVVPDLLWSNDANGAADWYNQQWLDYTGQTLATITGDGWRDVIHPDDLDALVRNFQAALASGEPLRQEHRLRRRDGAYRWFLVHARPLGNADGPILRWYGAATDIHEERMALEAEQEARAEAEAALKTREQFLSIASHELRTPLTSLLGYAHMLPIALKDGRGDPLRMAELITRQAQRLNTLIEQLLDVSRLQQGQFAIERQPVDLAELATRVVHEFRATLPFGTKHPIEIRRPSAPMMVVGDGSRLEQVIQNLLSNAVKYSPAGGSVHVRLMTTTTEAVLEIADQGMGIPAVAQANLFDAFYRARNVGLQISGLGLGLHIVSEIVQRHGGRIEVDSTEGRGSTFRVVLPLF